MLLHRIQQQNALRLCGLCERAIHVGGRRRERFRSGHAAECLAAAQQAGELAGSADPAELAAFFWIGWEGAVLRAKLERSDTPLALFAQFFFNGLPRR